MATKRKYAYYIKGNKIAIIEEGQGSGLCSLSGYNTQSACEDAGGTWTENASGINDNEYRSPIQTIEDGLEIQYAYSPVYSIDADSSFEKNTFYINGWTTTGGQGYLTFLRSHSASVPSWDASPYSAIGDGEFIVVRGSSRWNGLHKIQSGGADGTLQTYTKVNKSVPFIAGSSNIDITAEEDTSDPLDGIADRSRIAANNGSKIWLNNTFSTGDYIFVSGSEQAVNNGFWEISDVQADASNEIDSGIYIKNRYYCYDAANTISTEGIDTIPDTYATYDESVNIYKAYRDFCYIQGDIDVLNDESDTIDLSRYQANAVVYYLKAKLAEDMGDMEQREYFLREFKKQLEKGNSALKRGPYIVQGFKEMR